VIGFTLSLLLQGGAAPVVEDRLMVCQLRTATLSDPSVPTRLVPEGPQRLLAFRLRGSSTGRIEGSAVETHDPTAIMLGHSVEYVVQNNGTTGFVTRDIKSEGLSLVVNPAEPGRVGGDAYLNRLKRGRPAGFAVGACGTIPTRDPAATFEKIKALPGTQP
jgi:hypothetical protein